MHHDRVRGGMILIAGLMGMGLPVKAGTPEPTRPAVLGVDRETSRVLVKVGAEGYGHPHAVSGRLESGWIDLGASSKVGELIFDMRSFNADLPDVRQALGLGRAVSAGDQQKVTANMLGADVLDVARHPRAVFAIGSIRPIEGQAAGNPGRYQLQGEFTLHGVTRPLVVLASVEPTDRPGVLRMRGAFTLVQSQFGITPYSALAGLVRVADRLEVWGDLILSNSVGR